MKLSEYFSDPSKWNKGYNFIDNEGGKLDLPLEEEREKNKHLIKSCCILGAIKYCYKEQDQEAVRQKIYKHLGFNSGRNAIFRLLDWNDDPSRKFEDIKDLVDRCDI